MRVRSKARSKTAVTLCAVAMGCLSAHAVNMWWDDASYSGQSWNTTAGWNLDGGAPASAPPVASDLVLVKTDVLIESGVAAVGGEVRLSFGGIGGDVDLNMTGGSLNVGGNFHWAWNEADTHSAINLSGGDINIGSNFELAPKVENILTLNMSGGTLTTEKLTVLGGSMTLNVDGGTFTITDSIVQSSANIARVVDFGDGTGGGQFVVEWDFWNAAEQEQTWASRWYTWYMKSDNGFGADGVNWYYDDSDPLNRKTVFEAIPEPASLGLLALAGGALMAARRLHI